MRRQYTMLEESCRSLHISRSAFSTLTSRRAGSLDSALTNHGMAQINCLAQHFVTNSPKFTAVFSSDLSRARITAEGICHAQATISTETHLVPRLTQDLREKSFGSMEGQLWKATLPSPLPADWIVPESKTSMRKRAKTFFEEHLLPLLMCDPHGRQNVAVVAHGIILQELWSYLIEIFTPGDIGMSTSFQRPVWSNTGYTTISITQKQAERIASPILKQDFAFVVLCIDGREHLKNLHRTRSGVGSAAHDVKQKRIDQFFR